MNKINLDDRSIIEITGKDRKNFLQGLITNDINKVNEKILTYSAMLDARGRFLYDFFIFEKDENIFIDCSLENCAEITKKLSMYKLRSDVQIKKNQDLQVFWTDKEQSEDLFFQDPRNSNLGYRAYQIPTNEQPITNNQQPYHLARIENKIAEGEYDLTKEKSLILEFGFDDLNAIDYNKGCYVGQELTARTHHLGEVRKKIFHIQIPEYQKSESHNLISLKDEKITCEGKSIGVILSSVFKQGELHALALIKFTQDPDFATKLEYAQNKVLIVS